jgi:hypothetical protein
MSLYTAWTSLFTTWQMGDQVNAAPTKLGGMGKAPSRMYCTNKKVNKITALPEILVVCNFF